MHELVAQFFGAVEVADVNLEKPFERFVGATKLGLPLVEEVEVVMEEREVWVGWVLCFAA